MSSGGIWEGKQALSSFADLLTKFHSSGLGAVGTLLEDEVGPGTRQQPIWLKIDDPMLHGEFV